METEHTIDASKLLETKTSSWIITASKRCQNLINVSLEIFIFADILPQIKIVIFKFIQCLKQSNIVVKNVELFVFFFFFIRSVSTENMPPSSLSALRSDAAHRRNPTLAWGGFISIISQRGRYLTVWPGLPIGILYYHSVKGILYICVTIIVPQLQPWISRKFMDSVRKMIRSISRGWGQSRIDKILIISILIQEIRLKSDNN